MQRPTVMILIAINILHSTFPVSEIYIFIISIGAGSLSLIKVQLYKGSFKLEVFRMNNKTNLRGCYPPRPSV